MKQIDRNIGRMIKRRREALGLTQTEIGNACQVSFQQIQKYESGADRVAASRLIQIAHHLKTAPSAFLTDAAATANFKTTESL